MRGGAEAVELRIENERLERRAKSWEREAALNAEETDAAKAALEEVRAQAFSDAHADAEEALLAVQQTLTANRAALEEKP